MSAPCESRMTDLPILYSFRRCPYAMRARLALLLGEVVCEIREVVLRDKPAEMIAVSPKATVPVLVLPDGEVIDQSLDIMRWALDARAPPSSFPRMRESIFSEARASCGSEERDGRSCRGDDEEGVLIAANDGPFKHHLDRYKYPDRHDEVHLTHRTAATDILAGYETRLAQHAHLCGEDPSIADYAIMPFVRQFAAVDQTWFDAQKLPMLQYWLTQHIASPLFERAMIRLPAWRSNDPITVFPATA
jgi:glutathione S-transferase